MEEGPLFQFGLVADAQYADKDDTHFEGRVQRLRQAVGKLQAAVAHFRQRRDELAFVLHLGDIIDGNHSNEKTLSDLQTVLSVLHPLAEAGLPLHHVLGNHCLTAGRRPLMDALSLQQPYYSVALPCLWRLVVLDTTEMSGHSGAEQGSELAAEAAAFAAARPLGDAHPQMSPWNGGLGSAQMRWLESTLAAATASNERVIVASHHQLGQGAARPTHMAWNHREVLALLLAQPCVALVLAGHDHVGGAACVQGLQCVTLEGLVEAPPGSSAYAFVEVYRDRVAIKGHGSATSRDLPLRRVEQAGRGV